MLRPRWVLALLAALGIAAAFAVLSQWQLGRALEAAVVVERPTEEVQAFAGLVDPDAPTPQSATAQRVEVVGTWVPGDTVLVDGRLNHEELGTWVVAHLEVTDGAPAGLPIALGWAADRDDARAALDAFEAAVDPTAEVRVVGRFLPSEAPVAPDAGEDPQRITTVAVAQLVNLWADFDDRPAYFGYVTAADPAEGLDAISSPPPPVDGELNWLNVFYAVEWIVFAGFAIYLWYRLVQDAVEREREEAEAASADDSAAGELRT
ncbi:SURF1 family cytochrome oxidase biogenesis protein [Agromyces sp. MMS24-JH15]|uniref:SURF1 family cytochrome oxidase biogenesis protein n=1 Tax=Agromyces sp. MMS24-JH15 TaxID=3243765 RepID=UPI003748B6F6